MPWHYYLTQALPLLCTSILPFFVSGVYWSRSIKDPRMGQLIHIIGWSIFIYSAIPHKEWRFLHPLLPLIVIHASNTLLRLSANKPTRWVSRSLPVRKSYVLWTLSSLPLSVYVIYYHGAAQIEMIHHLRSLPDRELQSVGFLMPCHSTPMQSYLHRPHLEGGYLWALGCEPPLK